MRVQIGRGSKSTPREISCERFFEELDALFQKHGVCLFAEGHDATMHVECYDTLAVDELQRYGRWSPEAAARVGVRKP